MLVEILVPLGFVVFMVFWWWLLHRASEGRWFSPHWVAFSATAAAGLFLFTGAMGYRLDRHERFVAGSPWSGHIIWWQVLAGVGGAAAAALAWHKALRGSVDRGGRRSS